MSVKTFEGLLKVIYNNAGEFLLGRVDGRSSFASYFLLETTNFSAGEYVSGKCLHPTGQCWLFL